MNAELDSTKENAAIMQAEARVEWARETVEFADPSQLAVAKKVLAKAEAELAKLKSPWTSGRAA